MTANDPLQAEQPGPEEPASQVGLAKDIYQSTRDGHSKLIRLLATKLPLAIPPQSSDPGAFATGMLHLAPVYSTFEAQWYQHLLAGARGNDRVLAILQRIRLPGLLRADRIEADVRHMTGWSPKTLAEQIRAVTAGELAGFVAHIDRAVRERPLLLIAYSYLLYVGLFEGGRLIRATLENIGDDFWTAVPAAICPTMKACAKAPRSGHDLPLRFLRFDTPHEDDLRTQYEQRLADVEGRLTPQERADVIAEAHEIFARMALLITHVDGIVRSARPGQPSPQDEHVSASLLSWLDAAPGPRPRDSLLVAKERRSARTQRAGHTHSQGPRCSRSTTAAEHEEPGRVPPDDGPKSVKFQGGLPAPQGGG
ncbi:Heme-binding protein HMX1 [Escovopsis weberi]|uniref:Heme-binding protein HMX1 n=1 Tax=Escovopsis weberi TaxID=150374 RepID=A0A0M9VT51_ESCWE|nr:Heme-binding protein HMX1 [Escovopsis weberi]